MVNQNNQQLDLMWCYWEIYRDIRAKGHSL